MGVIQEGVWKTLKTVSLVVFVMEAATRGSPIESTSEVVDYLTRYGYLGEVGPRFEDTWEQALLEFQTFAGLERSGRFDNATRLLMNQPRCGSKDKLSVEPASNFKLNPRRVGWSVHALTYRISVYPRDPSLPRHRVDSEVKRAFEVWSDHTDLTFTPATSRDAKVHIDIRFAVGEHGDGSAFDGPGGILAHANYPFNGGDTHFDDTEEWTIGMGGINLFQVAVHEFGHALGLDHSEIRAAVMAPFYPGYDPYFKLHTYDIKGIQMLYGRKSAPTPTRPPVVRPPGVPLPPRGQPRIIPSRPRQVPTVKPKNPRVLCEDGNFDTILSVDGYTYVFKGVLYWKLSSTGIASVYPQNIFWYWPGLPGNLDAAFAHTNKNRTKTYFFKGQHYWRYTGMRLDMTYPRRISEGFKGIPDNIDAAFVWSLNNEIYFFKGHQFWRYNYNEQPAIQKHYPRLISEYWRGVPDDIGAALSTTDRRTYFFKHGQYYLFNDVSIMVEWSIYEPYPRPTVRRWFGCSSTVAIHQAAPLSVKARTGGEEKRFREPVDS